ncbi:ferrous iron transport protein B, partial [Campylobacter fetus subsp. venerealis]
EKAVVISPEASQGAGIDKILLHPVFGYLIFGAILLLIFQAIFAWASVPMDMIDGFFAELSGWVSSMLPDGPLSSLITEGIIPGIGGVV